MAYGLPIADRDSERENHLHRYRCAADRLGFAGRSSLTCWKPEIVDVETARSPLEQPPRKKCLQVSPAIDDQIDIDALTDDPVDHSVRFDIGLAIVADA